MRPVTEPAVEPLSADEEALVRTLGRVMTVLPKLIDHDLRQDAGISLTEYSTLMHLSEAPEKRLRMNELATACDLSLSGMTRAVARLESEGFVRRIRCDADGRGWHAVLTPEGLARLEAAYPTHLRSTRQRITDNFADFDLVTLTQALDKVGCPGSTPV
ncbi:MarR family transcriptional regulator [Asanoa ishikariensis]|uniref:Transcriptional regulator, MarR family n=1 Tax=Asanoa ishikariensis TaxID=137265 RepID=A0A1H3L3I8_9ACTN|nr:MarR family transcriptional regulator [Asanoa ishikariensis]GIF69545.1 MarR family transcriptional regulator [Asanoa ishikariensis]SDY58518.1 transcriptional regulator, MarR family [Asanoa ishikariensis]